MPKPKLGRSASAGALGGAIAVVLVWLLTALTSLDPPAEVAAAFATLCTTLVTWVVPEAEAEAE